MSPPILRTRMATARRDVPRGTRHRDFAAAVRAALPPWHNLAPVAMGGGVGTVARATFTAAFPAKAGGFPWSTFVENVVGAFLLTLLLTLLVERVTASPRVRLALCTGALGAFTTFSTLTLELHALATDGRVAGAAVYAAATLLAGSLAGIAGVVLARRRLRSP